jgi:TPR repeat protein
MMNRTKRGTLSSALLSAAKSFSAPDEDGADSAAPSRKISPEQPLAGTQPGEALDDEIARKIAAELQSTAAGIMFNKGAASAEAFKPSYWSYDQPDSPTSPAEPDISDTPPASAVSTEPTIHAAAGRSRPLWLAAAACSCLALVLPAVIFMLSLSRPADDGPAISPPTTAGDERPQDRPLTPERDTASLIARGDTFLGTGDIASARLYYEQAADGGNARAAMFLGLTFDPTFLDRVGTRGLHGDVTQAATWYRRARDLGEPEAMRLLAGLTAK